MFRVLKLEGFWAWDVEGLGASATSGASGNSAFWV